MSDDALELQVERTLPDGRRPPVDLAGLRRFLEGGQTLRIDLSVGEFRVEGADIDKVEAELRIECRWGNDHDCERLLEKVELESRTTSRSRIIEIARRRL